MSAIDGEDRLRRLLVPFRERHGVPALGAAVVTDSGDLDVCVIGDRRRGGSDLAAADDQWHIGSCAKSLTAALYARLVERGDASWDTPILDCFGDLAGEVDAGWAGPTIAEALVCRAGIGANLSGSEMHQAYLDTDPAVEQRSRAVRSALSNRPQDRGTFRYSNLGYIVVGAAIDRLSGMPYEEALRVHLLDPLGIASAGFGPPPDIWGHPGKLQLGGLVIGRGAPVPPDGVHSDNPPVLTPAGRLHLTLADWAALQRVFLEDGSALLHPHSIDRLLSAPPGKGAGMAMGWAPATGLGDVSHGMQGSNTYWVATALIDARRRRAAMVVTNDGRTRLLAQTARLATRLLQ